MQQPILSLEGITKCYGEHVALRGVDLTVERGEILGLIGPNGAGKTTLLSIIAGLRRSDAGTVVVDGVDARLRPRDAQAKIGYAPQDLGIYPVLTVRENLDLFGNLSGLSGTALARRRDDTAEILQLTSLFDRRARALSGGEKRRLHTAAAVIGNAPLLLLDEPTANADVQTRRALIEAVQALAIDGTGIIYTTHYFPEVEELAASIAIVDEGRVIARGTLEQIIGQHGRAAVEITFRGDLPATIELNHELVGSGVLRAVSNNPSETGVDLMQQLGAHGVDVIGLDVVRPSLEAAYMHLTGRRYNSGQAEEQTT